MSNVQRNEVDLMANCLYLGNYLWPWCTEVHIAREMAANGHQVHRVQEPKGGGSLRFIANLAERAIEREIDLFLWTRTWGLKPGATEFWRDMERAGIKTASYHLDLYLGLQREAKMVTDPFWTTQYVFTPDGNVGSCYRFIELGINHIWMPPAVVSNECVPGTFREEYAHDVIFVGSSNYHEEWPWRPQLIEALAKRYGDRFAHYGGTPETTVRTGFHSGVREHGLWLNDLYASAEVVVGDSLSLPGNTRYISDRYFETMGRGGTLVAPYVPVLDELGLQDGVHYARYENNDIEQVFRQVDRLLEDPLEAGNMAERARLFVRKNHTYRQRLAKAFEIMELSE